MKAFVIHDSDGVIRSIAVTGQQGKLQARPEPGAGFRMVEVELPAAAAQGDPHSPGFHTALRSLLRSHQLVNDKLVAIAATR